jgi:hypothetical protein
MVERSNLAVSMPIATEAFETSSDNALILFLLDPPPGSH